MSSEYVPFSGFTSDDLFYSSMRALLALPFEAARHSLVAYRWALIDVYAPTHYIEVLSFVEQCLVALNKTNPEETRVF
jgi:hypothetical protein